MESTCRKTLRQRSSSYYCFRLPAYWRINLIAAFLVWAEPGTGYSQNCARRRRRLWTIPSACGAAPRLSKNRCGNCHGKQLLGGEQMPPLSHQHEDYLMKALLDYKAERRLGDRAAMVEVVTPLSEAGLADLAHYLAHVRE